MAQVNQSSVSGRRKGVQSLLVEPYRQVKLGLMFVVLNTVFSISVFGLFGYYVYDIFSSISEYFRLTEQESILTASKLSVPIAVSVVSLVGFVALTIYLSIRYTHRIYGPLVSIHRYLDELLEKDSPPHPIILRESDQLQELAEKLNLVAQKMYGKKQEQNFSSSSSSHQNAS